MTDLALAIGAHVTPVAVFTLAAGVGAASNVYLIWRRALGSYLLWRELERGSLRHRFAGANLRRLALRAAAKTLLFALGIRAFSEGTAGNWTAAGLIVAAVAALSLDSLLDVQLEREAGIIIHQQEGRKRWEHP